VAEHALGNVPVLDRFIVTNDHDNRVMRELRRKANCGRDCGLFQLHPSRRYQIQSTGIPNVEGIETVANVLSIENDLVFNSLVDFCRIDQKVVASSRDLSERHLLTRDDRGQHRVRGKNIHEVYCLPHGDHWTVKGGSLAVFSNEKQLRQTIGADLRTAIGAEQEKRQHLVASLEEEKQEEARHRNELSVLQKKLNRAKKAVKLNDDSIAELLAKIASISEELEACGCATTIDTSDLEEDVKNTEEAIQSLKDNEQSFRVELEKHERSSHTVRIRLDEAKKRNVRMQKDISAAQRELMRHVQARSQQQDILDKKLQQLAKLRGSVGENEKTVAATEGIRNDALAKARRLQFMLLEREKAKKDEDENGGGAAAMRIPGEAGSDELEAIEPVVVEHDMDYYKARAERVKDQIKKERQRRQVKRNENPADAYAKYSQAKKDLDAETKKLCETKATLQSLLQDLEKRRERWTMFRNYLERRSKIKFSEMMLLNDYSGTLDFDHIQGTLDLVVRKKAEEYQAESSRDVKALSGGERSFATACLLLALGDSLETPFCIVDEIEICMDAETRRLTIKALIFVAKTHMRKRQFLFITPQDLSGIQADPELTIHQMQPPRTDDSSQQSAQFVTQDD